MNARPLLLAVAMCASLPLAACSSLSRPEEILIAAEPVAAAQKPAVQAPPAPAPAPAPQPVAMPVAPARPAAGG